METNDGDSADMEGEIEEADHVNESNDQKAIATEEDGEVNSDDESEEEGEIKDDDADCDVSSKDPTKRENKTLSGTSTGNSNASNNQQQKQICKFYAKGQCTWGINCRFLHVNAPPGKFSNLHAFLIELIFSIIHPTLDSCTSTYQIT